MARGKGATGARGGHHPPRAWHSVLLDRFAPDHGGGLATVGIRGGEDLGRFLLRLLGLAVAPVFLFGHGFGS